MTASGFAIIDHYGNPLFAATMNIGQSEVLIAKVIAVREGLLVGKHYQQPKNYCRK